MKVEKRIEYQSYSSESDLNDSQRSLLKHAREHLENSYSPYSKFKVSASLELDSGELINGTNQENVAYPSGLCAERVVFFNKGSNYKDQAIKRVAITVKSDKIDVNEPISPCGACRQVMLEYEFQQDTDIEVILQGASGPINVLNSIKDLLPLYFYEDRLGSS